MRACTTCLAAFFLAGLLLSGCGETTEEGGGGDGAGQSGAGASGSGGAGGTAGEGGAAGGGGPGDRAGQGGAGGEQQQSGSGGSGGTAGEGGAAGFKPVAGEGGSGSASEGGKAGSEEAGSGGAGGEPGGETPSVDPGDALYQRYEAPGFDNRCEVDGDCMATGCSGEVCAAEQVMTTCDLVPPPEGSCGCVQGECIWHLEAASNGTGGGCLQDKDCAAVSDYCEGCNCLALSVGESPPACQGNTVECFADPCLNRKAVCLGGGCALQ